MQEETSTDTPKNTLHHLLFGRGEAVWEQCEVFDIMSRQADDCRRICIPSTPEDSAALRQEISQMMTDGLIPEMRLVTVAHGLTIQVKENVYRKYVCPLIERELGVSILPATRIVPKNNAAVAMQEKLKAALLQQGWSAWKEKSDKFEHYYARIVPLDKLGISHRDDFSNALEMLREQVPGLGSLKQSLMISNGNMAKFTISPTDHAILKQEQGKYHAGSLRSTVSVLGLNPSRAAR